MNDFINFSSAPAGNLGLRGSTSESCSRLCAIHRPSRERAFDSYENILYLVKKITKTFIFGFFKKNHNFPQLPTDRISCFQETVDENKNEIRLCLVLIKLIHMF